VLSSQAAAQPVVLIGTAAPAAINHRRKIFISLQGNHKIQGPICTALCLAGLIVALTCGLPLPSTPVVHGYSNKSKDSGATLFHEKGCEHCHGVNGRGGELGPDLSTVGKRLSKEKIEHQIHDGGAAMPAFGDVLQPDEIKDLVDFLHAKRKAPKSTATAAQSQ
jgi:mono/diheme cytochrome c family protein